MKLKYKIYIQEISFLLLIKVIIVDFKKLVCFFYFGLLFIPILKSIIFSAYSMEDYISKNKNLNTWRCLVCQKEFKSRLGVRKHLETSHFENQPVQCHLCLKFSKNVYALKEHIRFMHKKGLN